MTCSTGQLPNGCDTISKAARKSKKSLIQQSPSMLISKGLSWRRGGCTATHDSGQPDQFQKCLQMRPAWLQAAGVAQQPAANHFLHTTLLLLSNLKT